MTIRRRSRAAAGRRPLIEAALDLLEMDGYRARLTGEDPHVLVAHRAAVERTLTRAEVDIVDQVLSGDVWGCVASVLDRELGGPAPDDDEKLAALTVILGREPRRGG